MRKVLKGRRIHQKVGCFLAYLGWGGENEVDTKSGVEQILRVGRAFGAGDQVGEFDSMGGDVLWGKGRDNGVQHQGVVAVLHVLFQDRLEHLRLSLVRNALQDPLQSRDQKLNVLRI